MELQASGVKPVDARALRFVDAAAPRAPAHDWAFDALTWWALRLGRVGPVRRALAGHVEARARAAVPASQLRHPLAVQQDKIALGPSLLAAAERGPPWREQYQEGQGTPPAPMKRQ